MKYFDCRGLPPLVLEELLCMAQELSLRTETDEQSVAVLRQWMKEKRFFGPYVLLSSRELSGVDTETVIDPNVPAGQLVMLQNTPDVIRLSDGGVEIRRDYYGNVGIVKGVR